MSVIIKSVISGSACGKRGIEDGDELIALNGHEINDVLDYRFYASAVRVTLKIKKKNGAEELHRIKTHGDPDELGLCFETYLMDKQHSCKNHCIFCFVDQMPEGMRPSLYFKDDDSRLSFLFGNYVTLTNMTERDVQRLIEMHISPVNVSVHTMNPRLRVQMMKNPRSGEVLSYIKTLAEGGIDINAQLVLCPGINDGKELEYSLSELYKLGEHIISVAAVPVGLTKHRRGLTELRPYEKDSARAVIKTVDEFNASHYASLGRNFAYCADEFFLKAQMPMPDCDYYDSFLQLDNGVGLWSLTKREFLNALDSLESCPDCNAAVITGVAAAPLIESLCEKMCEKFKNVKLKVIPVVNDFFGREVTVAGLVTAGDIINQCKSLADYDFAVIPSVMLRDGGDNVFLDDITLETLSERLGTPVRVSSKEGDGLLRAVCGGKGD